MTNTGSDAVDGDGVWCEIHSNAAHGGPALFLDRDGVVVEEVGYLYRPDDVVIVPGAAVVIGAANRRAVPVVLVTNQSGIGRGLYGWPEFITVQNTIIAALAAQGARLDAVYACPHHPNGKGDFLHPNHPARKPNPGMILRAAADLRLMLRRSWLVGDNATDVEAAKRAGLAGAMQVLTGHGPAHRAAALKLASAGFEVRLGASVADALTLPVLAS